MLNRILTVLYHFFWYTFAFIIINAAVLVTVVRLALPEIGNYNAEIQAWVSEQMDHPVVIEKISAEWRGWTPNLYLGNIDLYTQDNVSIITKFDSAHIGINLLASIRSREIIPNYLSVSGLDFDITRRLDGSISISSDNNLNSNNNAALSGWLLKQKHIILEDASVAWHDEKSQNETDEFSNVRILLKTDKQRVQLEADVTLPEQFGQFLSIKMDVTGNILTPNWSGSIYVEAEQLNPTNLLDEFRVNSVGGQANLKLWTRWKQSKLIDFNAEGDYSTFTLHVDGNGQAIDYIALTLSGERQQDQNWLLNVSVDSLETTNGVWPVSNHQISINNASNEKNFQLHSSYLKLEDIFPLLATNAVIPEKFKRLISAESLKGEFSDFNVTYNSATNNNDIIKIDTSFKNLSLITLDKTHSISGLEGSLIANSESVKIKLRSESGILQLGSLYDNPHLFSKLSADLELINTETAELLIPNLMFSTGDMSIKSAGKIKFDKQSPFIDIVAQLDETDIENMQSFIPKQASSDFKTWYKNAFSGGKLLSTHIIFHGYLNDYPFNNSEGHFKTIVNIENTTLDYNPEWPALDNVTAELILHNDDLTITSHSAYIFDAKINNISAEIKNLSNEELHLDITGSLTGHTSDARLFISQSPLKENKSLSTSMESIVGNFGLDLKLGIPSTEEATSVEGLIKLTDITIESEMPGLGLEDVDGQINFTNEEVWGSNITALYNGVPIHLNIPMTEQDGPYSENYQLSGIATKAFIVNQLASFFPTFSETGKSISNYFDGESEWSVSIKTLKPDGQKKIEFHSDLEGIEINLPYPFGKSKNDTRPLSISTNLNNLSINKIKFNFDDLFFTDVIVDNSKNLMIKNILIGLGHVHDDTPSTSDVSVQGRLEKLNFSEWIDIIALDNITPQKPVATDSKKISGIVSIENLKIFENDFNNININLSNPAEGWKIAFLGEGINGHSQFINGGENEEDKLIVSLDSLSLHKKDSPEASNNTEISKIPNLDIKIEVFSYNNNQLGQFNLQTNRIENGINISKLAITKPGFNINANGTWIRNDEIDRSEFYAKLESDSIETMLSTFNYNSANIKDGQTTIEMNGNWLDTPMNFSMEKIIGSLNMKIDKGQFLDIDPSAGRLFGLLSIQTLPRRLSLDFTDLFNKGFSFDSISGDFTMDQGHAYTNNLELIGPAANIVVNGRTGFITEDYDQIATITPKVSNSLPVASALFGPIGVGVGAVIYLTGELFKSIPDKIDQILRYQYSITGSWDNPDIVKIKKDNKSG